MDNKFDIVEEQGPHPYIDDLIASVYRVVYTNENGQSWKHFRSYTHHEHAESYRKVLCSRPTFTPNSDFWKPMEAVVMNFAFYVNEELVRLKVEDGWPREKSVYNVICEREDGKRLRHFKTFDDATACQALCDKILRAWSDDIPLSPKYWDSFPARYGSDYYCRSGEELRWRQEERDLERNDGYYDA